MARISIVSGGSWGTALAETLARSGHSSQLFVLEKKLAEKINQQQVNTDFFPEYTLSEKITATASLKEALDYGSYLILAIPTHVVRTVLDQINEINFIPDRKIISVTKGIEEETLLRCSEIIKEKGYQKVAVLSGPTHAEEVIVGNPTAAVVAAEDITLAREVRDLFMSRTFRVYTSRDVCGVELSGAVKNVIAIAAGIADGLGYGDNTTAALVTRGLAEIRRLGQHLGGKKVTFSGLAGLGDLVVTCNSSHSRNFRFGIFIAEGLSPNQAQKNVGQSVEGIKTCRAVKQLRDSINNEIEMPISEQIYQVLFNNKSPLAAVDELMLRAPKKEGQ